LPRFLRAWRCATKPIHARPSSRPGGRERTAALWPVRECTSCCFMPLVDSTSPLKHTYPHTRRDLCMRGGP
jgi:hypothetical protein